METPSQEPNIQSVNETGSVSTLTESIKDLLAKKLQYESLIWDFFRFEDGAFVVRNPNEKSGGELLAHHFERTPIVPGIMMKLLLLSLTKGKNLNKNKGLYIETRFSQSVVPGSKIFLGEDRMSLIDENGEKYIGIDYIHSMDTVDQEEYMRGFGRLEKIKPRRIKKFPKHELDQNLRQTGPFRFADSANFSLQKKEKDDVKSGDSFQGSYQLSLSHSCFIDVKGNEEEIYHGLFEEITAQIGSLAMGKVLGGVRSKILTFEKSIFKFDQKKLKERLNTYSTIYITGMVVKKVKKHISFIFIGKNEKGRHLFRGEISGSIMSAKALEKISAKGG